MREIVKFCAGLLPLGVLLFSGCAMQGHWFPLPVMRQEGVSREQFLKDKDFCDRYDIIGAVWRANYVACMEELGYTKLKS